MKIGTKSVLFGAHFFLTHWFFVAWGWFKLYGFSRVKIGEVVTFPDAAVDRQGTALHRQVYASLFMLRVWVAFVIHDWGYWGKPNMDGPEGETHPEWACRVMNRLFGAPWGSFVLDHSRFYAKKGNHPVSPLCYADKLAITLEWSWMYLPRVRLTGEIHEYMAGAVQREKSAGYTPDLSTEESWYRGVQEYMRKWVEEHKDGRADTWTATAKVPDQNGIWR